MNFKLTGRITLNKSITDENFQSEFEQFINEANETLLKKGAPDGY